MQSWRAKVGYHWFRNRDWVPIPWLLALAILPPDSRPQGQFLLFLILIILSAESLRLWAVGYAGSCTRTRNSSVTQLVHSGPYRFVRNPLYIANIALYTACSLLFGHVLLAVPLLIFFLLQYHFIVAFEEEALAKTFGDAYRNYCRRVHRWLVSPLALVGPSEHEFNFQRALRSERATLLVIAAVIILFVVRRTSVF